MKQLMFIERQILSFREGICFLFFVLVVFSLQGQSKPGLQLGNLFQDHMVLQREKPINIWGTALPGSEVTITMNENQVVVITSPLGQWEAVLPALEEKGPYSISVISGNERTTVKDVLLGDVWIASGQSNMEWPAKSTNFEETDTIWINEAEIRLIKILPETDYQPQKESKNLGWQILSPEVIPNFSAVAYHFGKYVNKKTGVPLGLISANLGATTIETWISNEALGEFPQFRKEVQQSGSFRELRTAFEEGKEEWSEKVYYSGRGLEEQWYGEAVVDSSAWKPIEVAGNTWQEVEDLKDFDGAVWFRKSFDLPENFSVDTLDLKLMQIDDHDITWVNGRKVGETFGKHNHRTYKVPRRDLRRKNNLIVVRVFDSGGIGGFTTNAFWGNELLWGIWQYRKGKSIEASSFGDPNLPNVTPFSSPGVLYNGTIAPLTALGIKGVIWYQGESNELRGHEYRSLFPALIRDWRRNFGQGDFPFLFVQLANYKEKPDLPAASQWAEVREAQALALQEPNTGMAVAIDLGEAGDIHPKNKEDVGKRLGRLANSLVYGSRELAQSPQYRSMKVEAGKALLTFDYVGDGLQTDEDRPIRGFQIAGADKTFHWASATLKDGKVIVESKDVKEPVAVRYAWSDNPGELNLYNSVELPLAPFRTDNWKLSTQGKIFDSGPRF